MDQFELYLLGTPRLELNGELVEVDTRKAIALLAYLVVTGKNHSRDTVAALFWPDYDQSHSRAALRRTLSALKKSLADKFLDITRETIGFDHQVEFWVDLKEFMQLLEDYKTHGHPESQVCHLCLAPLQKAIDLYRDDFLAGFTLRDSPAFDDWQFFQTENLRRKFSMALDRLVIVLILQSDLESAIGYSRRRLALDPLDEPAVRQLMKLYSWSGQRNAAMRLFKEIVRTLEHELGVTPLEETQQLYQEIKEHILPPPPVSKPVRPIDSREQTTELEFHPDVTIHRPPVFPLVGRNAELSLIQTRYSLIEKTGGFIAVEGEAGVGKTRLVEEFLRIAQSKGSICMVGRCYEGEANLAYGPFIECLKVGLEQKAGSEWWRDIPTLLLKEASRLVPEIADLAIGVRLENPMEDASAQTRFYEAISQVLVALSIYEAPGVVFLDDMHWADQASLDLMMYLIRRLHRRPIFILVTWRSEHVPVDHRLRSLISEARRAGFADIINLSRLNHSDIVELVRATPLLHMKITEETIDRLALETEGLPFFVVEYLQSVTKESLVKEEAVWSMPGSVRDLLHTRLAIIDSTGQQLLQTAAVIGRSFDYDTLQAASGRSDDETVRALEDLIRYGIIQEIGGLPGRLVYDFNHEKLRNLVYEETSLTRRRLLHRRVAEAIQNQARLMPTGGSFNLPPQASQIAMHFHHAGQDVTAAEYYVMAGDYARNLYANAEAINHFNAALSLEYHDRARLHEEIGDLYTLLGDYVNAVSHYHRAVSMTGSNHQAVAFLEFKLGSINQRRGEWAESEMRYRSALELLGEDGKPGIKARIFADWSKTADRQGRPEDALDLAQKALATAEMGEDQAALAHAHNILGVLARRMDDFEKAHWHLNLSLETARLLNDPAPRIAAFNNMALLSSDCGEYDKAIGFVEAALDLCHQIGDRHREAALQNNLADLYYTTGQVDLAMEHLKKAVVIFAEVGGEPGSSPPEIWKMTDW